MNRRLKDVLKKMKRRMEDVWERARIPWLQSWASLVVRCRKPTIVGVTGSVGKTTTKELIAAALSHKDARETVGLVWWSHGSMNDNDGLPLAVLGFPDYPKTRLQDFVWLCTLPVRSLGLCTLAAYPKVLVLEYGAGPGNNSVSRLVSIAPPGVAVVTAIGPAHLETFKTIEGIVEEKSALLRKVPRTGLVVLGRDNPHAADMDRYTTARVVKVPGRGRELADNIACAVADYFGVSSQIARLAAAERGAIERRLEITESHAVKVIKDFYNANPLSMRLGLDTLVEVAAPSQRRVAILGMMAELGTDGPRYHTELAEYARPKVDLMVGVGSLAVHYEADHWFATSADCAQRIHEIVRPGDVVLVKGSFFLNMGLIARSIEGGPPSGQSEGAPTAS